MGKVISFDLRRRVVEAYKLGEGGYGTLAKRFSVALSSVQRWVGLDNFFGDCSARPHAGGVPPKITEEQWPQLKTLIEEKSDRTLAELAEEWNARNNTNVHYSSIDRALRRMGITLKKRNSWQRKGTALTS